MATTTVYTCDICKQSKSKESLSTIQVQTDGIHIKDCDRYRPLRIDICTDCLKKKGFIVENKNDDDEKKIEARNRNKMTLEDKIYEILSDIGVAFEE